MHDLLSGIPNVTLVAPLEYQPMIWLLQRSHFVITDSGELQEEAAAMGKPVLVIREKTERSEGIIAGTAILVGIDEHALEAWAMRLLTDSSLYKRMARVTHSYGDGYAARRIADTLREHSPYDRDDPGERS